MLDIPRWKESDTLKPKKGEFVKFNRTQALKIVHEHNTTLPSIGYERSLGNDLWLAKHGSHYELRQY